MKLLEKNIGKAFSDIKLVNISSGQSPKAKKNEQKQTNKKTKNPVGPSQTDKFFHRKGNHKENKKTAYSMGENSFKGCNRQGLNLYNIQTSYTTQQHKSQQPNGKMGKRHEETFLQGRYTDGQ